MGLHTLSPSFGWLWPPPAQWSPTRIPRPKVSLGPHAPSSRALAHFTFYVICSHHTSGSASQGCRPGLGWTLALAARVQNAQSMCVGRKASLAQLAPSSPREDWTDDVPEGVQCETQKVHSESCTLLIHPTIFGKLLDLSKPQSPNP